MNAKIAALALAQCCFWFATLVGISLSAIIGMKLSPRADLATLPFALASFGALMSTYALSTYMQRNGRRSGLRLGALLGVASAALSCVALQIESFWLFCTASIVLGCYQASSAFYRLAAMDEAENNHKSTAMSWVLCGSLLAALIGPSLAKYANSFSIGAVFTGPYLIVLLFSLTGFLSLGLLDRKPPTSTKKEPLSASSVPSDSTYWVGVINTGFSQFLMMLMMVIAPLAMHSAGFAVSTSLSVIGWHIIGMFLPSFYSGKLIDRYGELQLLIGGYIVFGMSSLVALVGQTASHYYLSLFLLGFAWNFVYVAGTSQYNKAVTVANKGKSQGIAELSIALAGTVAVFAGGIMINSLSWSIINNYVLFGSSLAILLNLLKKRSEKKKTVI